MKRFTNILAVSAALLFHPVMAQEDISGTWQGKLSLGGDQTLTVQFIMTKEANGSWSAVVNSPDMGGIKNIEADSAEFDGSNLNIDVAELSGAYAGILKDGTFEGEWSQAGSSMELNLSQYEKPVMSEADVETLLGEWVGKINLPAGEMTIIFKFASNDGGELDGTVRLPDQGGNEMPTQDVLLQDGEFSMKLPAATAEITGTIAGNKLTGKLKQGPNTMDLSLTKGAYEAPEYVLDLSREAMDQLMGEWHGEVDTPMGRVTVVYRFETNEEGKYVAFRDNPDQGADGIPIQEATFTDGNVMIKNAGPGGEYNGTLAGGEITGEIKGPMGAVTLNLKKGEYVPPSYRLSLSSEAMQQLEGKWEGNLKTPQRELTLIFRFESNGDGEYFGYVDSPDQGANGLKMTEASLNDGELSLKIKFPSAEYKGKLNGNNLEGEWKQGPQGMPLTMTKI